MNVIKHKWFFLGFSAILVAASIFGYFAYGLKPGIDFTGGTLWQFSFNGPASDTAIPANGKPDQELLKAAFVKGGDTDAIVVESGVQGGTFMVKTKEMDEPKHQQYATMIRNDFGPFTELSFESIGASIGAELTRKALWAFVINLLAISLYVAYAFRKVSHPVSSWKYALITLATLFHDGLIPVGLFAFLGYFMGIEVDTNFIVAILVVIGFSVHDTIVVFDRIRENLRIGKASEDFGALVNRSINETIARSINTSLTLVIVLAVLFVLGAASLKFFVLAMLVGTIAGTYSSIFVASPLLVVWQGGKKKS